MSDKLQLNIPKIPTFQLNQEQLDNISNQNTIKYEDGKSPMEMLERQAIANENAISVIQELAESAEKIANSSSIQSNLAVKKSKKADIKGLIAIIISFIALFFEFASNHEEIIAYVKSFFNN